MRIPIVKFGIALAFLQLTSIAGAAVEATGLVRVLRSGPGSQVVLASSTATVKVCQDDEARSVGRIVGMEVKVSGDWSQTGPTRCFKVNRIVEVTKASSGRKPLVGQLKKDGTSFYVVDSSQTKAYLTRVPAGLADLINKKVIVDVKKMSTPGKQASTVVVTYALFPE